MERIFGEPDQKLLYTLWKNSNVYVSFLTNTLATIVRVDIFADKVVTTSSRYLLHTVCKYSIFLML